jgi:hypothetical protein
LIPSSNGVCGRCGRDVRLYTTLQCLPGRLYNDAHRLLREGEQEAAASLVQHALALREEFPEAHWLLAVIEMRRGRTVHARRSLARAHALGADVDLLWLEEKPVESVDAVRLTLAEALLAPASSAGIEASLAGELQSHIPESDRTTELS